MKQGVIPPDEGTETVKGDVQFNATTGAVAHRVAGYRWTATQRLLEVEADGPDSDPGQFVKAVLEQLPHTPVQAVGNNFHFGIEPSIAEPLAGLLGSALSAGLPSEEFQLVGQSATLRLAAQTAHDAVVNLTVESDGGSATLLKFNFHREVGSAEAAGKVGEFWQDDLKAAILLASRMEDLTT